MFELSEIELQRLGTLFINFFKQKLQERIYPYGNPQRGVGDKVATGQLLNSLTATAMPKAGGGFELVITYMDYFKNVNLGRRPGVGMVPIPALLDWIKVRGIEAENQMDNLCPIFRLHSQSVETFISLVSVLLIFMIKHMIHSKHYWKILHLSFKMNITDYMTQSGEMSRTSYNKLWIKNSHQ